MRTKHLKDQNGDLKFERDDDWPMVIVRFSTSERVIYTADGQRLMLQLRNRDLRNDKWSPWRSIGWTNSHAEMRKLMGASHPFTSDNEKLDAICLKTDDGDYVEHSH